MFVVVLNKESKVDFLAFYFLNDITIVSVLEKENVF